jgi:hypothetical protein
MEKDARMKVYIKNKENLTVNSIQNYKQIENIKKYHNPYNISQ